MSAAAIQPEPKGGPRTAADVILALQQRFSAPEFAFFEQVRNGTGYYNGQRYADAMAFGLWPSRGLHLHGVEVKVSRADWLRELKNPAKADELVAYCDFWWVAVSDPKIIADGELPATWGLLVPHGSGMKAKVQAPKLDPEPLDRLFVASLLRRAHEVRPDQAAIDAARKQGREQGVKDMQQKMEWAEDRRVRLEEAVNKFEAASGVRVRDAWNAGDIGAAVRAISHGAHLHTLRHLEQTKAGLERVLANVSEELTKLDAAVKAPENNHP